MIESQNSKGKTFYFLLALFTFYFLLFTSASAQEATPSSEEKARQILEAVRERIKARQLEPKRKAYVGNLKSIADSTLVLETKEGVKQANVSTEAAILRVSEKTKNKIKFEDLTIGEFTIAMGYIDENQVLEAKRVVVSKEPEEDKRKAICGMVGEVNLKKKALVITQLKTEQAWTLKLTSKTEINKKELAEIEPGDRLVVIGIPQEETTLTAHRIYITND